MPTPSGTFNHSEGTPLRRYIVGGIAALGLLGAAPVVAPAAPAKSTSPIITCKQATIGGQSRCIARGQFCARSHARDYRRYGLSCTKRDANGRYHLR
jgi:hypothetical protein